MLVVMPQPTPFRPLLPLLTLLPVAAQAEVETGITSTGPAIFIFATAGALFLTLVLRSASNYVMRVVGARVGRWRIRTVLDRFSADILHEFIVPGAYGGLARIEYAVLTSGGVLCLQSKFCNGAIFGEADDAQWTNVDGGSRQRFLNPLIQGEGRRRALQNIVPNAPVANLVVFTGAIEFMSTLPDNVIHIGELATTLKGLEFGSSTVEDWDVLWLTLRAAAKTDADSRKDYAAQLSFG
jgi:hypothetical protein